MNTKQLIERLGGTVAVRQETGLSKGRISQWVTANKIPRPWLLYFQEKRPDIPWAEYTPSSALCAYPLQQCEQVAA